MAKQADGSNSVLRTIADSTRQFGNNFLTGLDIVIKSISRADRADGSNVAVADRADGSDVDVAESTRQFGNNFLKVVADGNPGNLITSSLSAQVVLAMAAYGAGGNTATQMRSALLIPSDNEFGQSGYKDMIESFNKIGEGIELRLANKIYIASQFEVKSAYKELTTINFLSASQEVDFNNPSTAAATINDWCEDQTNGRIKDVIDPDTIDSDTAMVLVNAVYFKGNWKRKFGPHRTKNRPFQVDEKTTRSVPTMFIQRKFRHGNIPELDARFIEIPYEGDEFSMIIILPNEIGGLKRVQDNLHQLNMKKSMQHTHTYYREIELFLPKFRIESTMDLQEPLEKLGMTDMFQNYADFSGTSDVPLKVAKVVQKAFIDVNEEGSEAAAATYVRDTALCGFDPTLFDVNRPYYYAVYHSKTGISLFTGFVQQPEYS